MKKTAIVLMCLVSIFLIFSPLTAQKIEDFVSSYTNQNGQKYMQPLGDAFGANLNSGWYHSARISTMGIHIYVGAEVMVAQIGDKQKTFTATTEGSYYPETAIEAPTVFGDIKPVSVSNSTAGITYTFPGGMDVKMVPLIVPQVTVGSIMGTEASIRWVDFKIGKDLGKLSLMGVGVRHSISQYIPLIPVDLSVGFFMQNFKVGDIVKATSTFMGVQGSVKASILTLYGGIGYEKANIKINYTSDYGDISFNFDAKNKVRMNVGAALNLIGLNIHADYNLATQNVLVLGVGLGF